MKMSSILYRNGVWRSRKIGLRVLYRAVLRWYTTNSLSSVALIRPSVRTGAPSPQGKALTSTVYHKKYNFINLYHVNRAFPWGEGGREADE